MVYIPNKYRLIELLCIAYICIQSADQTIFKIYIFFLSINHNFFLVLNV